MITDAFLTFGTAQAVTADAASTDYIDAITTGLGDGEPLRFVVHCVAAFNTLTSLNIKLQSDDNSSFSSASDDVVINVLLAGLTANTKVVDVSVPRGLQRYIRAYYDVVGTDPTTGKLTAGLVVDSQHQVDYPSGFGSAY
jgi:uncharacterized membrane protein